MCSTLVPVVLFLGLLQRHRRLQAAHFCGQSSMDGEAVSHLEQGFRVYSGQRARRRRRVLEKCKTQRRRGSCCSTVASPREDCGHARIHRLPAWPAPPQAPEVIEQSPDNVGFRNDGSGRPDDGYDEAADIWSLGITALEVRPAPAGISAQWCGVAAAGGRGTGSGPAGPRCASAVGNGRSAPLLVRALAPSLFALVLS